MKEEYNVREFRDGIFSLRTRRFGSVAEIMIKSLFDLDESHRLEYDKYDSASKMRVEIKFSTVMKKNEDTIKDDNVVEQCLQANVAKRAMSYMDVDKYQFDCNIQQIKRTEFDVLYYGLFFADKILIFRMHSSDVLRCVGYSDSQHRGNEGEGQFHIKNDNLQYHMKNFFIKELTYFDLLELFKQL